LDDSNPALCGQGYKPTIEEVNRLSEIDEKLKQFSTPEEWQSKGLENQHRTPTDFSWIATDELPKRKSSSLVITDDGVFKRIPVGKLSGIDYLREQREDRLQKKKLQDINEAISAMYNNTEKVPEADIAALIEQYRATAKNDTTTTATSIGASSVTPQPASSDLTMEEHKTN